MSDTDPPSLPPSELPELDELTMERVLVELESRCEENMQQAIETEEGLGIEYDEDVVCDVCRSPEGEDGNEMVFCDKCNICVHQVQIRVRWRWAILLGEEAVRSCRDIKSFLSFERGCTCLVSVKSVWTGLRVFLGVRVRLGMGGFVVLWGHGKI